jgi:hypothetical protein
LHQEQNFPGKENRNNSNIGMKLRRNTAQETSLPNSQALLQNLAQQMPPKTLKHLQSYEANRSVNRSGNTSNQGSQPRAKTSLLLAQTTNLTAM